MLKQGTVQESVFAMTLVTTENQGSHIMLSQINTLHCQQKELEHEGGQG